MSDYYLWWDNNTTSFGASLAFFDDLTVVGATFTGYESKVGAVVIHSGYPVAAYLTDVKNPDNIHVPSLSMTSDFIAIGIPLFEAGIFLFFF